MDGNPNVNAYTIRRSLEYHRREIIKKYIPEMVSLSRFLSQSLTEVNVSQAVSEQLAKYQEMLPNEAGKIGQRIRNMPYRCLLKLMMGRMQGVLDNSAGAYRNSQEFQADLELIHQSMKMNRGQHAGIFCAQSLQIREKTFGFHLATLDIRQDSLVHRQVIGKILADDAWIDLEADIRADRLTEQLLSTELPELPDDEFVAKTIEVFRSIGWGT